MPSFTPLTINPLSQPPNSELLAYAQQLSQAYRTRQVTEEALVNIGTALWHWLELSTLDTSTAVMIEYSGTILDNLPWESLYHPRYGFLSQHAEFTLSRKIISNNNALPLQVHPLKILLWTSQPKKASRTRLNIEIEQQVVYTALLPFIKEGIIHFYAPHDGRLATLGDLLHSQIWHVVILTGHSVLRQQQATFLFEGENGEPDGISATELATLFQETGVQCVVIAACQSAQDLTATSQNNLVMPLLQAGIPHLIGMREPLIDRAGTIFVQNFCVALAQGIRIDVAVQQARRAMITLLTHHEIWRDAHQRQQIDPSVGQWCLPILLSHDPTQPLLHQVIISATKTISPKLPESQIAQQLSPPARWFGNPLDLTKIFIGYRQALRTLTEAVFEGTTRSLLIHGIGGVGKSAFAKQLAIALHQQGFHVLAYQGNEEVNFINFFINFVAQSLGIYFDYNELAKMNATLTAEETLSFCEKFWQSVDQGNWLIWLDNLEWVQHLHTGILRDEALPSVLHRWHESAKIRVLLTSRQVVPNMPSLEVYTLQRPDFDDFSHYIQAQGWNYSFAEILKIYQILGGNFQGVQLLQSLPINNASSLADKLAIAHRYLQAYLRK